MARTRVAKWLAAVMLAATTGGLAGAADGAAGRLPAREASIPFANHGGIRDWRVVGESTLLIQDIHGQWYLAKLQAGAFYPPYSENLCFATGPSGTLEKMDSVVVRGRKYPIVSLTRTDPPSK